MIKLPEYWLQTPDVSPSHKDLEAFQKLYSETVNQEDAAKIDYNLATPKWQFLNYLVEKHGIVLHGSGNPSIKLFEPRKAEDISEFGNQKAVFAAADGVWPMFFAIIDRENYPVTVNNACVQFVKGGPLTGNSYYLFSISQGMVKEKPWKKGVVYLLPPETFVEQPTMQFGEYTVRVKQQVSLVPVEPIAQIEIEPADFPFLSKIREHDDSRMEEYATAMQTGADWPE
ncbi:MAG: hypothetical protein AAGD96_16385 [Chloroflexota bacterium]